MSFVVDIELSSEALAESLMGQRAKMRGLSILLLTDSLEALSQKVIADVLAAKAKADQKFFYWCQVLWQLREAGSELAGAIYQGLTVALQHRADLTGTLGSDTQSWFLSLNNSYPPASGSLREWVPPKDSPNTSSISVSPSESGVLRRSYASFASLYSHTSLDTLSNSKADALVPELEEQQSEGVKARDTFRYQQQQVIYFKGVYTALRAEKTFKWGNFLKNLTDPSLTAQFRVIQTHAKAAWSLFGGESPSCTAWRKAEAFFKNRRFAPFTDGESNALSEKIRAFFKEYEKLRHYPRLNSNFASKLKGLPLLAQWAAIEHHVSNNPNSRSAIAWQSVQPTAAPIIEERNRVKLTSSSLPIKQPSPRKSDGFCSLPPAASQETIMMGISYRSSTSALSSSPLFLGDFTPISEIRRQAVLQQSV